MYVGRVWGTTCQLEGFPSRTVAVTDTGLQEPPPRPMRSLWPDPHICGICVAETISRFHAKENSQYMGSEAISETLSFRVGFA